MPDRRLRRSGSSFIRKASNGFGVAGSRWGWPEIQRIERLASVDLSGNQMTPAVIEALRAAGVNLRAEAQYTAEQIEDGQHLLEGDWE